MVDSGPVYVVEDDSAVRRTIRNVLEEFGFRVREFATAEEFLAGYEPHAAGCLITDLDMPGMGGMELHRRLHESDADLSVVVVTGVAEVSDAIEVMERGAITLLQKPYEVPDLISAIHKGLRQSDRKHQRRRQCLDVERRLQSLTDEERQVMDLMVAGAPNKAISLGLSMSMRTVDRRRKAVLDKMGVETLMELVALLATHRQNGTPNAN